MLERFDVLRHLIGPDWVADFDERMHMGWVTTSAARCMPEIAWVWHAGAAYIELPASWEDLVATFNLRRSVPLDGDWDKLHTVPGQLLWATSQLRIAMESGSHELRARWRAIAEFLEDQWPEWFEAFQRPSPGLEGPAVREYLDVFEKYAVLVAFAHASVSLAKWMRNGSDRSRMYPVLDAIAYIKQGVPYEQALKSRVGSDRWWDDLLADVIGSHQRQSRLARIFETPHDTDSDSLGHLEETVRRFGDTLTHSSSVDETLASAMYRVGEQIVRALDDLNESGRRLRENVRRDLTSICGPSVVSVKP